MEISEVKICETDDPLFNDFNYKGKEKQNNSELNEFRNSLKFGKLNKRYTCKLPFNDECEFLPDNFSTAKSRLLSLQKTLLKDKKLAHTYGSIINEY